ncbi:MAG: hypothetical protein WBA89_08275 [Microcoleus sp.]|uniref:hypothetical protein n=1 Tax=unclassified Microcoleus TaxID=2642155 RepID=UPI002FD08DDC
MSISLRQLRKKIKEIGLFALASQPSEFLPAPLLGRLRPKIFVPAAGEVSELDQEFLEIQGSAGSY